jgi:hypothetical protein
LAYKYNTTEEVAFNPPFVCSVIPCAGRSFRRYKDTSVQLLDTFLPFPQLPPRNLLVYPAAKLLPLYGLPGFYGFARVYRPFGTPPAKLIGRLLKMNSVAYDITRNIAVVRSALRAIAGHCEGAHSPDGAGFDKLATVRMSTPSRQRLEDRSLPNPAPTTLAPIAICKPKPKQVHLSPAKI